MDSQYWSDWAGKFQRGHFTPVVLTILDALEPLKMVLAQGMLAFSPFIASTGKSSWIAFASMLEDPNESDMFRDYLRRGDA
jgi:hypothetical protein